MRFAICSASRSTRRRCCRRMQQACGFDTNADALSMEPALLDRYLTAAAKIARLAVGDPTLRPTFERYTAVEGQRERADVAVADRPSGRRLSAGLARRHRRAPLLSARWRVHLQDSAGTDLCRRDPRPERAERHRDPRRRRARRAVHDWRRPELAVADPDRAGQRMPSTPPTKRCRSVCRSRPDSARWSPPSSRPTTSSPRGWARRAFRSGAANRTSPTLPLAISSLLIGGPYNGRVAAGFAQPPAHLRLPPAQSGERDSHARRKILSTLARRAYRRPATSDDVQTLARFLQDRAPSEDFDAGIRAALERVLVSPDFLFRIEADPDGVAPEARRIVCPMSSWRRACRSSCGAASRTTNCSTWRFAASCASRTSSSGRCGGCSPTRARAPRSCDNFFGQWLQTRNVWLLTPDVNRKFPWFDDNLRIAFVRETELFLDDQLKADRSIVDLLTANGHVPQRAARQALRHCRRATAATSGA